MLKKLGVNIIVILFGLLLLKQDGFSQKLTLKEIKSFAQKGNDTTLVLLNSIKPSINFESDTDVALEFYLIEHRYYLLINAKQNAKEALQKSKIFYDQSNNEYLKLYYEVACIYRDEIDLINLESRIRNCQERAKKIGASDLLVETHRFLFRFFRKLVAKDSMNYHLEESYRIAKVNNLKVLEAQILNIKGRQAFATLNTEQAYTYYDMAEKIYTEQGHELNAAKILIQKARWYQAKGQSEKAFRAYQKTRDIFKENNLNYHVTLTNRYMGQLHQTLGNNEEAIKHFILAKETLVYSLFPYLYARLITDLGISYFSTGRLREGKACLTESIALKEKLNDLITLTHSYNSLGALCLQEGNLEAAKLQFEKAIANHQKRKENIFNYHSYKGLLDVYIAKGEIKLAEKFSKLLQTDSTETRPLEDRLATLISFAKLSTLQKDYKQATQYYQVSFSLRDSVINFKEALKIVHIKTEYQNQKKEIEILKLENENQEKTAVIKQNKLRSTLYLLSLFFVFIIFLMFTGSYIQNKKASAEQKKLNVSLNESNQQLEQFAHIVSHDLKSPLITITSFSSILEKTVTFKLNEKEKTYFNYIVKCGKNLSEMIDDMLAYSKIGSQNIKLELTDVNLLIEDVLSSLAIQAQKNHIELKYLATPAECMVDKVKLSRVLQNLISNAIKFYDPNKNERHITINYKKLDDFYQFSITDNGIGIPKTDKNIFEPFIYLNSKENYKGTGMGLAMCKKIIQKHGGEIWYESELEKGTTFYFTIYS